MQTDEQLVEHARQGSAAAFDELVLRYRDKLLRFLLTRCASHADAEDAIQDTFVNAYRYLDSFNPRWRFSTWLYRIALRNAARVRVFATTDVEPSHNEGPLARCIVDSERENLWLTARKTLSADAFTAMWLHYAEDMQVSDVSRVLEKSLSWTKVSLMRSRRRLGQALGETGDGNERRAEYG